MVATAQDAVATYLQTGGYGTLGSTLFIDFIPPTPANVVVCTGYSGARPERTLGSKLPVMDYPRVQVLVRNTDPTTALTNIVSISDYLEGTSATTAAGVYMVYILQTSSGALYLGKDSNNWTSFSTNFEVKIT